jgi:NAD(P)H dehydrogenase (quinone)
MATSLPRLLVTGASGQLGRLVLRQLLEITPASSLVATARKPEALADLATVGVEVRAADYTDAKALDAAFAGVDRVLLISSNAMGERVTQHETVIAAAKRAGVAFLAYTSVLHADISPLELAEEHRQTEALLQRSNLPHAILRNGWYTENYLATRAARAAPGALLGAAGDGRIASAARADYAAAAAAVLSAEAVSAGRIFELAGDTAYTLAEFAAEIARRSGQPTVYRNLPQAEFEAVLRAAGLPGPLAALLADSDAVTAKGALFDDSGELSRLIGRPTTPMSVTIAQALAQT